MNRHHFGRLVSLVSLASLSTLGAATQAQTGTPAIINDERVNIRQGPGSQFERFTLLDKEAKVVEIGRQNDWSQIRLQNGKTGWLNKRFLRYQTPPNPVPASTTPQPSTQPAKPATATAQPVKTAAQAPPSGSVRPAAPAKTVPAPKPAPQATAKPAPKPEPQPTRTASKPAPKLAARANSTGDAKPAVTASAASTVPTQAPSPNVKAPAPSDASLSGLLVDTKKDPFAGAGPAVGIGDAFRMLLYLLPILGLIVLAVRALKRFQEKTGTLPALPALRGSMLGGFNLSNARKVGGSNIRVVESVPVGSMELHVVEVRGRMLLLSSSGGAVNLLTELKDGAEGESEFQAMLGSLTRGAGVYDEDEDDLDGDGDVYLGATVGSLDDTLRETREAIVKSAQRTLSSRSMEDEGDYEGTTSDQFAALLSKSRRR